MRWLKTKEVRKRLFVTISLLAIFFVGMSLKLPFVVYGTKGDNQLFNFFSLTTGGTLERFGFLALGISPYITSTIIMQLAIKLSSKLETYTKMGARGQTIITSLTRLCTLFFATIMAISFVYNPTLLEPLGVLVVENRPTLVLLLVAGSMFTQFLAERITDKGLGHGTSILIGFGLLLSLPEQALSVINAYRYYELAGQLNHYWTTVVILLLSILGIIILSVIVNKITFNYPLQSKANKYRVKAHFYTIKLLASSVMPIIFTSSLYSILSLYAQSTNQTWGWLNYREPLGLFIYSVFIMMFTFLYNFMQIDTTQVQSQLEDSSTYLLGVKSTDTANYLARKLLKITPLGAITLAFVATISIGIELFTPAQFSITFLGIPILLLVGIASEFIYQVNGLTNRQKYKEIV